MTTSRRQIVQIVVTFAALIFVSAGVDILTGYPTLPYMQKYPHDLVQSVIGLVLWFRVIRT